MGLSLTRKRQESIIIGDDIQVTIADISGDKVRIWISAPKRVSIHRLEVYEQINGPYVDRNSEDR